MQFCPEVIVYPQPFVRREAVLSSRIEGTRASLSDLYAYEVVQLALFELSSDVQEEYNYVQALEYGVVVVPISASEDGG